MSLYVSDERTAHSRTFANITDAENTDQIHFRIVKRDHEIMAERQLFLNDSSSVSLNAGKHKEKDWNAGFTFRYRF